MCGSYPDAPDMDLFNRMFQPKEKYTLNPSYKDDEGNIVQPSPWLTRNRDQWERAIDFATRNFEYRIPEENRYDATKRGTPGVYLSLVSSLEELGPHRVVEFYSELFIIMPKNEITDEGEKAFMGNLASLIGGGGKRLDLEVKDVINKHLTNLEVLDVYIPMSAFRQAGLPAFTIRVRFELDQYREDPGGYADFIVDLTRDWPNMLAAVEDLKEQWKKAGVLKTGEEPEEEVKEQTEPYQKKVKAKHNRMKIRLIGVGGRSKSAPPAG